METLFQNKYRIESNRKPFWDYSSFGYYFVTICTNNREHYFGKIVNDQIILNNIGHMVNNEWKISENIRNEIILDCFVIMPNHLHGIVIINNVETNGRSSLPIRRFAHQHQRVFGRIPGILCHGNIRKLIWLPHRQRLRWTDNPRRIAALRF